MERRLQNSTDSYQLTFSTGRSFPLKVNIDLDQDPSNFKEPYQGIERWQRPVEQVNWYEAVEYCDRLSKLSGKNYRLPSEAEWEYACRGVREPLDLKKGESYPPFHFGETITTDLANYRGTDNEEYKWSGSYGKGPKGVYREETTPVGYFQVVNVFGLGDMHGNVWEWCADDWHNNYENAPNDGSAWLDKENFLTSQSIANSGKNEENEPNKVLRGGSWYEVPIFCRSASRIYYIPRFYRLSYVGFRVVCGFGRT